MATAASVGGYGHGASYGHYAEDTLDTALFDPIAYINQKFPTENSLEEIDTFVVGVGCKISALDDEISRAVQAQSRAGEQATRDISEAQFAIKELFEKIGDIKTKASQSERMVQEICADIKKLDCAKNHLQSTITSLKRLQMLITAVGQLEVAICLSLCFSLPRPLSLTLSLCLSLILSWAWRVVADDL
jgi:vacuolar protein sorting-associated protein 53